MNQTRNLMEILIVQWAPAFALIGVLITLVINYRMHERRIQVENQRLIDQREFEAKKQAYVELLETISSCLNYLNSIPDYEGIIPPESPINNLSTKSYIVQLYANNKTLEEGLEFNRKFMHSYIEIMRAKSPITGILAEVNEIRAAIESYKSWNQDLKNSKEHAELIDRNWKTIKELSSKLEEMRKRQKIICESCRDVVLHKMPEILGAMIGYLSLIREDLGIKFNKSRYEETMKASLDYAVNYTNKLASDIRKT